MRINISMLSLFILMGAEPCSAFIETYDLAADWSNTANPNGVWSYNRGVGDPHPTNIPDYFANGTMEPAWADADLLNVGHVSVFLKSSGLPPGAVGRILTHPNDLVNSLPAYQNEVANIAWTSPGNGKIDITGGIWLASKELQRNTDWALRINGSLLTGGTIGWQEPFDESNTKPFSSGSGGTAAVNDIVVAAGDDVRLELLRNPSFSAATFTGVDLTIVAVPEPSTLVFLSLAIHLGVASFRLREF